MIFPFDVPAVRLSQASLSMGYDAIVSGPFDSGREVILNKRDTSMMDFDVAWSRACWNQFRSLRKFFDKVRGIYGVFTMVIPFGQGYGVDERLGYEHLYVGIGDGSTTVWDLPMLELPDTIDEDHFELSTDRVPLVYTTDYTLSDSVFSLPTDFNAWTGYGGGTDAILGGQPDPVSGTGASLLTFSGAGPRGLFRLGNAVPAGDDVDVDVWLKSVTGSFQATIWAQDDGGGSVAVPVTVTEDWTKFSARSTAAAAANKLMQIGFTGSQTPTSLYAYKARIGPGRDGKAQATYAVAPAEGALLTVSGRFCPAIPVRFAANALKWTPGIGYVVDIQAAFREVRLVA